MEDLPRTIENPAPPTPNVVVARRSLTKQQLAARYCVGIRTIETWCQRRIIAGTPSGRLHLFDPADCDGQIRTFVNTQNHMQATQAPQTETRYATKRMMADRYHVSLRTISKWMPLGILTFFKIRNVVRFDVAACDAALKEHGLI